MKLTDSYFNNKHIEIFIQIKLSQKSRNTAHFKSQSSKSWVTETKNSKASVLASSNALTHKSFRLWRIDTYVLTPIHGENTQPSGINKRKLDPKCRIYPTASKLWFMCENKTTKEALAKAKLLRTLPFDWKFWGGRENNCNQKPNPQVHARMSLILICIVYVVKKLSSKNVLKLLKSIEPSQKIIGTFSTGPCLQFNAHECCSGKKHP